MGFLTASIVCVLISGCGEPPTPEPPAPPPPLSQFAISYDRSGGFAPMPRSLTVRPGGQATVTELRPSSGTRRASFHLSTPKLKQLRAAAEAAQIEGPIVVPDLTCADCFVYTVAYRGQTVSYDQTDVPSRMRALISRAEALISAHLPRH